MRRFSRVDFAIAASCLALAALSFAFGETNGLVATWEPGSGPHYTRQYNSTGSDDDLMIQVGLLLFGGCFVVVGWWPCRSALAVAKGGMFTAAWGLQLLALAWIEVGSLRLTVFADHNAVLGLWLVLYFSSLPLIWSILVSSLLGRKTSAPLEQAI